MRGHSLFRPANQGAGTSRAAGTPGRSRVSDELARLTRLEHELERACMRYERAIAELDQRAGRLRLAHPPAEQIVQTVMAEPTEGDEGELAKKRLRLSSASFEDLRGLGLSITQARRVLKHRDRGALKSPAGLDAVPGLPHKQRALLKLRLRD
jgi:hypothetical protein